MEKQVNASALLAVMADGIGDLSFAAPEWVSVAADVLSAAVARRASGLGDLGRFTFCEVAHNAPAWLHGASTLAWHARFDGVRVEVAAGELPDQACDFKLQGDHSILSNLTRIQYHGKDPVLVAAAQARLQKLSRWVVHGKLPAHPVLGSVLRELHDAMAARTLPRFSFMTPEWVSSARHLLCTRAVSDKYRDGIRDVDFTFSEQFTQTPRYAFPDGSDGGFWVRCARGHVTVGAGPLPAALAPADMLNYGSILPVYPVGRTVNAVMTDDDKAEQAEYRKVAFANDPVTGKPPVVGSAPSGKGPMPPALGRIFMPLHDELSKRTSGDLPCDYETGIPPQWSQPQRFDRAAGYDKSWLRYDLYDVYGNPRSQSKV